MTATKAKRKSMGGGRRFDADRFRGLAIAVLQATDVDPRNLFDAMFLMDMEAYRQLGKSITGTTWLKTETGVAPRVPKPRKKATA